ncbi:hypothetical protein XENOCAPTIV_013579, partial [Xenoophorus captivus]
NAKPFPSSDSLAKVQEVASWLLEMNQDLLSGGSSSRRSRGLGGQAVRGNASSTTRAPQQAAEDGDEDEHINRVVEVQQRVRPQNQQRHLGKESIANRFLIRLLSLFFLWVSTAGGITS